MAFPYTVIPSCPQISGSLCHSQYAVQQCICRYVRGTHLGEAEGVWKCRNFTKLFRLCYGKIPTLAGTDWFYSVAQWCYIVTVMAHSSTLVSDGVTLWCYIAYLYWPLKLLLPIKPIFASFWPSLVSGPSLITSSRCLLERENENIRLL